MKNILGVCFVVAALLSGARVSLAQWYWVNPLPQGNALSDIWLFDRSDFLAVGDYGTVLRTTDGGSHWLVKRNVDNLQQNIAAVDFTDSNNGWAVAGEYILHTTDSGNNWEIQYTADAVMLHCIFFKDANNGIAAGSNGILLVTHNGANSWTRVSLDSSVDWLSAQFFDVKDGIAAGVHYSANVDSAYSVVYVTADSGRTWVGAQQTHFGAVGEYILDEKTAWVFSDSLYKTTDLGHTWSGQGYPGNRMISLCFLDDSTGWSIVESEIPDIPIRYVYHFVLEKTSDGGRSWNEVRELRYDPNQKLKFLDKDRGYLIGKNGNILCTTDGGDSWNYLTNDFNVNGLGSIYFPSASVGYILSDARKILKTTDGGKNWGVLPNSPPVAYTVGDFLNENSGFVGTNGGNLYKTTNGGESWHEIDLYSQGLCTCVYSISFVDTNVGLVSGYPCVLKTTDGGVTWSKDERFMLPYQLINIDRSLGYLITEDGSLYVTTDLGGTWTNVTSRAPVLFQSFTFFGGRIGFATGKDGSAMITEDAGVSWSKIYFPEGFELKGTYFLDSLAGYAVGDSGKVLYTKDGGKQWIQQESPTKGDFTSVFFNDRNKGFITGPNGVLLATLNGGFTSIRNSSEFGLPEGYSLLQNYPNPFNPSTVISYRLPSQGYVTLTIYDILGRKIKTLVSERQRSGSRSVTLDATALPSGVYFYRLQAGTFVETRKLMVLK